MTAPIPEAAVEAAARALSPNPAHWRQFMGNARTALIAARPLMEADLLTKFSRDQADIAGDVLRGSGWLSPVDVEKYEANFRLTIAAEIRGSVDDMGDPHPGWREGMMSAATIAERTQR